MTKCLTKHWVKFNCIPWQSLNSVVTNFLGKPPECRIREWPTLEFLTTQGTNVSQTRLSAVTLGLFTKTCGDLSEEQDERFHQDVCIMEGRWDINFFADNYRCLKQDCDGNEGVLRIPQRSSITGALLSDCLVSYPGLSFRGVLHLCRGAVSVSYSPSRLDMVAAKNRSKSLKRHFISEYLLLCIFQLNMAQYELSTNISSKVKLATVVEGDLEAPFSIATTPRCRGGRYFIPWIDSLYPWSVPYNAEC